MSYLRKLLAMVVLAFWVCPAMAVDAPATVKVAAVQCSSNLGDVAGNRAKLTKLIEEAAKNGAKIVVLPEAAVTGYLSQDLKTNWHLAGWPIEQSFTGKDPAPFAETVPGPSTEHFAALAKRLGVYITVPLVEVVKDKTPRYFNTVCLAAPSGQIVAHYRKLTPWPYPEKSWATPGDRGVATYQTEYGLVGLAICFDIHTILEKYQPHHIWALLTRSPGSTRSIRRSGSGIACRSGSSRSTTMWWGRTGAWIRSRGGGVMVFRRSTRRRGKSWRRRSRFTGRRLFTPSFGLRRRRSSG